MQVRASLSVEIAASTALNQLEEVVQEAGRHARREATGKGCEPEKNRARPARPVEARGCGARGETAECSCRTAGTWCWPAVVCAAQPVAEAFAQQSRVGRDWRQAPSRLA